MSKSKTTTLVKTSPATLGRTVVPPPKQGNNNTPSHVSGQDSGKSQSQMNSSDSTKK